MKEGFFRHTRRAYYNYADLKIAERDETMMELLFGDNPITDDELRALIKKRPHVYGRYEGYLGKR